MIRPAVFAAILVAAGVLATLSAGGPPAPELVHFGVTHARPVAGHVFTGVTVTPAAETLAGWSVDCVAKVKGATVPSRQRRYYGPQGGIAAITCSWKIPAKTRGLLRADVLVLTIEGGGSGTSASWRIRH